MTAGAIIFGAMGLNLPENSDSVQQREILDALPVFVFLEREGKIVYANAEARCALGYSEEKWRPRPLEDAIWGLHAGAANSQTQLSSLRRSVAFHATMPDKQGCLLPIEGVYSPLGDDPRQSIIVAHRVGRAHVPKPPLMEDVLACIPEAVLMMHGDRVLYANPAFSRMFGYSAEEISGAAAHSLIVPETRQLEIASIERIVDEQGHAAMETVRVAKNGDLLDVAMVAGPLLIHGAKAGYVYSFRDIAERKRLESKLQHDAMHDALTGLPNRALFLDRLNLALARRLRSHGQSCGLLFLDLDRFKEVNDTLGHAAGDALLTEVAERLRGALRSQDTAARLGGDEFAVLVDCIGSAADLEVVASRILQQMKRPFDLFGRAADAGVSIGAAMAGPEHLAPELLLRDADYAMYRAKQAGGSRYEVFDKSLEGDVVSQQDRERELRQVLDKRLYEIWYQPILRLSNRKIEGFEALLRWRRESGAVDSFKRLLPIAEETGLSIGMGRDILDAVCKQLRCWTETFAKADLSLTVNVSKRQFYHSEWVAQIKRTLAATGVDPSRLLFEIPETVLAENSVTASVILQGMLECNVRIGIDGFGASLGPLSQLVAYPIDVVKLDHKLTAAALQGGRAAAMARTIFQFGRELGVQVIAQGIETVEQIAALKELGCELGQGRILSDAINVQQAEAMLAQSPPVGTTSA
jgi:diguanylate cyclase (GGDEF)-like protein/PAS domain S-box-containing protein